MPQDSHRRAAEFHDLAAHAHRVAAVHHGKEDHQTGHEHSKQAMEHSARAYRHSQEAHQKSVDTAGGTRKNGRPVSAVTEQGSAVPEETDARSGKPSKKKSES